jgi:Aspartate/tyrosine/aromatic aminotransferase
MKAKGADLIDLGIGDPDIPTPKHIIDALKKAAEDPANHRYPSYEGMPTFREAAANWYKERFGVSIDTKNRSYNPYRIKGGNSAYTSCFY